MLRPAVKGIPEYVAAARARGVRSRKEIGARRRRFWIPAEARLGGGYEAGRAGFRPQRYLCAQVIENHVVDSSSLEVKWHRRCRNSDGPDVRG